MRTGAGKSGRRSGTGEVRRPRRKHPGLPPRLHLPSGRVVHLDASRADAARKAARAAGGPFAASLAALGTPGLLRSAGAEDIDPSGLALRDAAVLRAVLARSGVLPEPAGRYTCENCGGPFRARPSSRLEIGPFVDGELGDPELDAPFDFEREYPIPAIRLPPGSARPIARSLRLAPRAVEEARSLWRAVDAAGESGPLRLSPAVVRAAGIVSLGGEPRPKRIADALAAAPDEAWDAVAALFDAAHYPARLLAAFRCSACGARNDLPAPLHRELEPGEARRDAEGFPDAAAFEARVRGIAAEVYRARGVRNVDLVIDEGVPACDDGGEPLLGCYTPGGEGELGPRPPEVRLFYRTFAAEFARSDLAEVDAEIRETIDHELEHHLNHLAGHDPLDAGERAAIAEEEERRVGRRELARRARRSLAGDLVGFLRVTWPLWLFLSLAGYWMWC